MAIRKCANIFFFYAMFVFFNLYDDSDQNMILSFI